MLLGLAVTTLGFAGLFTVFTYIEPILTQITVFGDAAVSPILLVFGGLVGGRLADKRLVPTVLSTLILRAVQQDRHGRFRRCGIATAPEALA